MEINIEKQKDRNHEIILCIEGEEGEESQITTGGLSQFLNPNSVIPNFQVQSTTGIHGFRQWHFTLVRSRRRCSVQFITRRRRRRRSGFNVVAVAV